MNFKLLLCVAIFALVSNRCDAAVGDNCQKGSDCGRDECCLYPGSCQPMLDVGDICDSNQPYQWQKPETIVLGYAKCPCQVGYFCFPIIKHSRNGLCTYGK